MNGMRKCNDEVYQLAKDTHWKTFADPKFISLTTIQVGKKIKDRKERVFGSVYFIFFKYIVH
jgi:hypothetical protein